jgi:hypothetical protein
MSALEQFKSRLCSEWLLPFCFPRGYSPEGFRYESVEKLAPADADDFMQAIDHGLVSHHAGRFTAPCSKATEQIFWEGARKDAPRKITLWLEPVITIAGLMRLHRKFGWPAGVLGLQSKTWAFDLVAYHADRDSERIVCEVKKSVGEVDRLITFMEKHASTPAEGEVGVSGPERNALRKVTALRSSASEVFWVLGPGRYERIFKVHRHAPGTIALHPTAESDLFYRDAPHTHPM